MPKRPAPRKRAKPSGRRPVIIAPSEPIDAALTPRQELFVREFLIDLNAAQAARRAGYSPATAARTGSENLAKPLIAQAITRLMSNRTRKLDITADRVLQGLAEIGFGNMLDFVTIDPETGDPTIDLRKIDRTQAGAIQEITTETITRGKGDDEHTVTRTKLKLANRHAALVTLAQHLKIIGMDAPDANVQTVRFIIEGAPPPLVEQYQSHGELIDVTPSQRDET